MEIPKWLDRYIMDNGGAKVFTPPPPSPNESEIEAKIVKEYLDSLKKSFTRRLRISRKK